jgi:hypothetical protein
VVATSLALDHWSCSNGRHYLHFGAFRAIAKWRRPELITKRVPLLRFEEALASRCFGQVRVLETPRGR